VNWTQVAPAGTFVPTGQGQVWVGARYVLKWAANIAPCTITTNVPTGPGTSVLTGLPAEGTVELYFAASSNQGLVELRCGPGDGVPLVSRTVQPIEPTINFMANSTDRKLGQFLHLNWHSIADTCTPTGGSANDGWTDLQRGPGGGFHYTAQKVGTFTYALTCTAGSSTLRKEITVKFTDDAPYVTLQPSKTMFLVGEPYTLTIKSNIENCYLSHAHPENAATRVWTAPEGTLQGYIYGLGTHTLQADCSNNGESAVSAPVILTVTDIPPRPPVIGLTTTVESPVVGQSFTVNWAASNATSCTAEGHPDFTGEKPIEGSQVLRATQTGNLTIALTCTGNGISVTERKTFPITAAPSAPANNGSNDAGGGGGGGGSSGYFTLLVLAFLAELRRRATPLRACRCAR
jgi:hypothetical protein